MIILIRFLCRAKNYTDTSSYVIKESPFDSIRTLIAVHKCNDICSRQNLASDATGERRAFQKAFAATTTYTPKQKQQQPFGI